MRVSRTLTSLLLLGGFATHALAGDRIDGALVGKVVTAEQPLSTTRVYAYQTSGLQLRKVLTDRDGVFLFERLPAGLYKIIALKPGFLPAVVMLTRATSEATQFLEVELARESSNPREAEASFWRIREQIPGDVLRDIDQPVLLADRDANAGGRDISLTTRMQAVAGVHETIDAGDAQVNGAQVGVEGQINKVAIDFSGRFSELESHGFGADRPTGTSQAVTLQIEPGERSRVAVASHSNSLLTFDGDQPSNVDFERHRVSWSRAIGRTGQSDFSAQYTEENNYYRQALIYPGWIPTASRAWRLEGSYSTALGSRSTLEAGLKYRDRESDYTRLRRGQPLLPTESVELYGRGGLEVNPTVLVHYGVYSAMRDGELSLAPQGGFILNLGRNWKASTLVSRRVDRKNDDVLLTDFTPTYFEDNRSCRDDAIYCYEVEVERAFGSDDRLSLAAVNRKIGDTQRLFFDNDFLDRFDSLYLVEGDQLPELRLEFTRRLTPEIVTTISSNVAAGGGGLLQAGGRRKTYENEVSYIVTSVDTTFEETSTGVFLAFHRLEQELNPIRGRRTAPALELERLQLGVTQDLDVLRHLATELALHLNMELSRGDSSDSSVLALEDLRRRITGGFAVRF